MCLPHPSTSFGLLPTPGTRRGHSPILGAPPSPANSSANAFAVNAAELEAAPKNVPSHINNVDNDTYHAASQEYRMYMQQRCPPFLGNSACRSIGRLNYQTEIDPITPCLVAGVRITDLIRDVKSFSDLPGAKALLEGLRILRTECKNINDLLETRRDVIDKARTRKHINDEIPMINPTVCGALRYLHEKCHFFDCRPWGRYKPRIGCGAFFVAKSNGKL